MSEGKTDDARRYDACVVRALVAELARAVGVPREDAEVFADALVDADVRGVPTHGVSRLEIYLRRIRLGLIDPRPEMRVEARTDAVLAVDAGNGLGHVQGWRVLQLLIPRARRIGLSAAAVRRSNHLGALSYFCNQAAEAGMLLLAVTNGEPGMSPEGGCEAYFGTNPLAMSFPTGHGFPAKIDLATSVVARGNIIAARKRGDAIPEGWALDRNGLPTTDAERAFDGTVRTMAGHKGYALAVLVEALAGVLSGAGIGAEVGSMYRDLDRRQDVGHFFCLFDIAAFIDPGEFRARMDAMIDAVKASRRRPGTEEILIPGERSHNAARRHLADGIPLTCETVTEIETLCAELDVPCTLRQR